MFTRRRRTTVRFCLAPLLALIFLMSSSSAAQASLIPSPCAILPSPANLICGGGIPGISSIPGIPNTVSTVVNHVVGQAANAIVQPVIHEVTKLFAGAMTAMLKAIFQVVSNTTEPELTAPWFEHLFELIAGIALVIGVGFLIPTMYEGIKEGDLDYVGESAAIFGGFIALLVLLVGVVAGVLWLVDGQIVPYMTNNALGDLQQTMANHKVDFTKDTTLANNAVTPILIPFVGGLIGFLGGFFTWVLFEVRNVMIYFMVTAEALAAAMAVGRRWGNDIFVRTTMALIAWVMLRFIMAIILIIAIRMVEAPNKSAILTGAFALGAMPFITWAFVKSMANHRISALGSALNARAMWDALPFTGP
jgi:hypothetical protein